MSQMKKSEITERMNKVTSISDAKAKKKEFLAPEEIVQELHACDVMYTSLKSQLANMIETHTKEQKDALTIAPLFLGLIKSAAEAYKEFEKAKFLLAKQLPVDAGYEITDWSCDYESKRVAYEEVKTISKNEKVIMIPEAVWNHVWDTQLYHQVVADVITWLTDSYANAKKDTITTSAVFKGMLALKARLFDDYDHAKAEMYASQVPTEDKAKYTNWSLSFDGGVLTLTE